MERVCAKRTLVDHAGSAGWAQTTELSRVYDIFVAEGVVCGVGAGLRGGCLVTFRNTS